MKFKLGDKVVVMESFDETAILHEGTITKLDKNIMWLDKKHAPEDALYTHWAWPAACKEELIEICQKRKELKKAYDESICLIYQLRNKLTRNEN